MRVEPLSMRILIVGINYAPEEAGIGPYTAGLAEHLVRLGHRVEVVTGLPHYPAWRVARNDGRASGRTEVISDVPIRRVWHYVPRRQSAMRRALYEGTFLATSIAASLRRRPDVVIGIVPSLSGAVAARALGFAKRAPYGILFQDLMAPAARESGISGGGRVAGATGWVERWVTAGAGAVAAVSPDFIPVLEQYGAPRDRVFLLRNWTRIEMPATDRAATRRRLGWPDDATIVVHAGNMGLKQGLEAIVDTGRVVDARGLGIRFVLLGEGNQREDLMARARGVKSVTFVDPVEAAELPAFLRAADVLLVSERPTVSTMSLPSKLTSYLLAGRPVLAAVAPGGATAREVERSGAGIVVPAGDLEALVGGIERLRDNRGLADRCAAAGPAYVEAELRIERTLREAGAFVAAIAASRAVGRPIEQVDPVGAAPSGDQP